MLFYSGILELAHGSAAFETGTKCFHWFALLLCGWQDHYSLFWYSILVSRMTSLSKAGKDFRHHFGTAGALQPQIVGATGAKAALRDVETWHVDGDGNVEENSGPVPTKRASIPKDVRLPAFLIVLNCFCSTASYVIEFSTFAIFFKQEHNWNVAVFASLAQTAGDVMAAIAMQVIPAIFPDSFNKAEAGPIRRFFHYIWCRSPTPSPPPCSPGSFSTLR